MRLRHGPLSVEIPEGWEDHSTLLLIAPRPTASVPTANEVVTATEAVSIQLAPGTADPQQMLRQQAEELTQGAAAFAVQSEGPFSCALGEGWSHIQRLDIGMGPTLQIAIAIPLSGSVLLATAAAAEHRFNQVETQLREILASLEPAA